MPNLSRREALGVTGRAAVVALAGAAGMATAAKAAPSFEEAMAAFNALDPKAREFLRAVSQHECDQPLLDLYAKYRVLEQHTSRAWDDCHAESEAVERSVFKGKTIDEHCAAKSARGRHGYLSAAERKRWDVARDARPQPTKWHVANELSTQLRAIIAEIQAIPAEGIFGIVIELVSLPAHRDEMDVVDAVKLVVADCNRLLLGAAFPFETGYEELDAAAEDEVDA